MTPEKAHFEKMNTEQIADWVIKQVKESYELKVKHDEPSSVVGMERYIILNAIDRLWQEHLFAMDSLREAVYLRAYGQKDPLVEYKTEAYDIFVDLMSRIKNEVVSNLFRSSSNLMAFEQFLSNLPQNLISQDDPLGDPAFESPSPRELAGVTATRDDDKIGRNDPCPCGSGRKFKSCCGRNA
jgi:preprotein translocase subunit SecA